jgi:DNA-binding transcriptional LysR family regulator
MKIDERHLAVLAAVVEAGGVSEGAAHLGTSQPAISRTLSMLEKRIGEKLFLPGRRPLQPTALGRQLATHGKSILAAQRKASDTIASFRTGTSGRMRIAGAPFFMDAIISGIIASFQVLEPGIHFEQSYGHYNELLQSLRAGEIDLAVTPSGSLENDNDLVFEPLVQARNVIACAKGHPLLSRRKLQRGDFLAFPWVAPLPNSPLKLDLINILMMLDVDELAIRYAGGSLHAVINYIASSQALAIMPQGVIHSLGAASLIAMLPINIPQPERRIGVFHRRLAETDPVQRKFLGHLRSNLNNLNRILTRDNTQTKWESGPFANSKL